MSENEKNDRTKLSVFSIVLALVVLAVVLIAVRAMVHREPPPTVRTLMAALNVPASVSVDDGLREAVQESFQNEFSALYGIDLADEEAAYFSNLLKECKAEFDIEPFLRATLRTECIRRSLSEGNMIRQLMGIRDPAEQEKIRAEWTAAGHAAVLSSEEFIRAMEPVYRKFYEWWTPRHPEYEGIACGITLTDDHEALVEQIAVSLRRELVVHMAQELLARFETELRKIGKVISEAKMKQAFALFLRLARERYTEKMTRKLADAVVREAELTDDEVLHCLLLKDRRLSEDRLSTIQDVQMRYLTASTQDQVPAETASAIQKELQALTGLGSAQ
ncbi:MAG: hypothetical protein IJT68_05400 [Lentisphaeria bacterium]|nr:hypothetical protein [Lentisphaeria bacterium]